MRKNRCNRFQLQSNRSNCQWPKIQMRHTKMYREIWLWLYLLKKSLRQFISLTSKTCVHKVGFLIKYKFMSNIPFELSALTQSEFLQIDVNNKLNCHDLWIFKFLLVYHKSFYLINYSMKHNISYDRCLIHYELFSFIPISLASTA